MYINPDVAYAKVKDIDMLFNFDNGVVAGIDQRGLAFYKDVISHQVSEKNQLTDEESDFFNYLIENEFISDSPFIKKDQVVTAYLHLTNRCNLHCVGCYSYDEKRNRDEDLTLEDMLNGIRLLKDAGIENLVFSGGEPLLRRDLIKILRFAKVECQIPNIVLITNGTVYNKTIISEMSKFVDTVSVSVDSYSAECPSFIRDSGIFNRIMDTVSLLKENGNNVNLIPTVHHLNADKLLEYVNLAEKMGVSVSFSILSACFEGEMKRFLPNAKDIRSISNFMIDSDLSLEDSAIRGETLQAENYCGAGKTMISIGTDGNVYPCHMLMEEKFCLGNIKDHTIVHMRENTNKLFSSISVDNVKGCNRCEYKYLCGGGCCARAYMKHRDIYKKDPYCELFFNYYENLTTNLFLNN